MKSIKQQFTDLKEGKITQSQFMRNVRMTLPQYITNVTSFNDTVKILKNKAILTESDIYGTAGNPEEEADRRREMNSFKTPEERYNVGREIDMAELDFLKKLYAKYQTTELEQEISDLKKKLGLMESYNSNSSGKDSYSVFPEIDNLNSQEVLSGIDWEMQNDQTLTKNEATKIVIKKLKKNPFYYTDWDMSGVEGAKAEYMNKLPRPADWQMKPVKGGSLVDKSMGMKPVKDVEKAKASSNKANQETNKLVKGVKELTHKAIRAKGIKGVMDMTGGKMKKINIKENQQYVSRKDIINKILGVSKLYDQEKLEKMEGKDLIRIWRNLGQAYKAPMRETTNLPGGDNVDDIAGHQLEEKKANSLKIGEKFKMQANLGDFKKGQEVEVIDIQRWGEDFRITLSNGEDKDTFTIDKNDEL